MTSPASSRGEAPGAAAYRLAPDCVLKDLEKPSLYHIGRDELYELSPDAWEFLRRVALGEPVRIKAEDGEFFDTCVREGLLAPADGKFAAHPALDPAPRPSLRSLEILLTDRCNLRCRHCYLGEAGTRDLPAEDVRKAMAEFERMQGLRLLLSGGEPLLHPRFWEVNDSLRDHAFRSVLLTNGALVTSAVARRLSVHEAQVSLDGLKDGHDALRGEGSFAKALASIGHLAQAGIDVSVATMIHGKNLDQFEPLADLVEGLGVREWNVDALCPGGRLRENRAFEVAPEVAGRYLEKYGFGGGFHGAAEGYACGSHLCAVLPDGKVAKCGLFAHEPVGSLAEGLAACWKKVPKVRLDQLACDCPWTEECRGGCRFRAREGTRGKDGFFQPDPYQCSARGIRKGGERRDHHQGG